MTFAFLLFRFISYAGRRFFLEGEAPGRTRLNTLLPTAGLGCGQRRLRKSKAMVHRSLLRPQPSLHPAARSRGGFEGHFAVHRYRRLNCTMLALHVHTKLRYEKQKIHTCTMHQLHAIPEPSPNFFMIPFPQNATPSLHAAAHRRARRHRLQT